MNGTRTAPRRPDGGLPGRIRDMIPRLMPVSLLRRDDVILMDWRRLRVTRSEPLRGSEFFTRVLGFLPRTHEPAKLLTGSGRRVLVLSRDRRKDRRVLEQAPGIVIEART